jgi:small subunit ribosomal protein S4
LGFAKTRRQARQLVSHRHIVVNDQVVNIPSYHVKPGDVISIRPKSRNLDIVVETLESYSTSRYKWMETDKKSKSGKFLNVPVMEEIPENINVQLIIELYSK